MFVIKMLIKVVWFKKFLKDFKKVWIKVRDVMCF